MNESAPVLWITDHDPASFWVSRRQKLGNMTTIALGGRRGGMMDFDQLNEAALEAITSTSAELEPPRTATPARAGPFGPP